MGGDATVYDVRFSGYDGNRTPSWQAVIVLAWWSLLRTFGRRRGWGAKFVPWALLFLAFLPGLGVLTVRGLLASEFDGPNELPIDLLPYVGYLGFITTLIVVWTALVTPELICPDLQYRVTSLYFATAVSPWRYVLGKWIACMTALLGMTMLPVLLLWIGNVLFADSVVDAITEDADMLPRIIAAGLVVAVFFSTIGLAIAAQTGRRAYASGTFVGIALGSSILAGALGVAVSPALGTAVNVIGVPFQLAERIYRENYVNMTAAISGYVVMVGAAAAALWLRFRKAS